MEDCDKTKDQLIAELELLRSEMAALKQAGRSQIQTQLPQTTPAAANLTLAPSLNLATDRPETSQYTILLVDDSEVDRATYRRFLSEDGDRTYEIVEFDNGEDALQWCDRQIPDIFLLDYYLPDIDGLDLLEELLQQTGRENLPVIMLTGQANIQIVVDLLKNGAQDYLEKSQITPEVLHRSISYVLRNSQLMKEREWQQQQQQILAKTTLAIRDSLKLEDILNTTVTEIRNILLCDRVIIFKFVSDWSGTVAVESVDSAWPTILSTQIDDPCLAESYFEQLKKRFLTAKSDIYTEIAPCHLELLAGFQVRANLVVPILQDENLWGLLIAHQCTAPREWQPSEIELLRQLSAQASIAIQQADLFEQLETELRERKQAELALHETQEKLQLFIKYSPASIVMFDRDLCYLAASQRWADEYRLKNIESIIGRSHYELFPDLPEGLKYSHQRGLAGFIEKCDEDEFVHSDGLKQWLRWEIHPWYRSNGAVGGIVVFTEDITDRKQAQIALQQINIELEQRVVERTAELTQANDYLLVNLLEKEHTYQLLKEQAQLLDLAQDSIITWDLNSVITFWNQGAELMYGWTKAEALGQESHILLKTQFSQPLAEIKAELFETGYCEAELIHYTRDERQINVASRWVVQKDDAGRPINILEINNDVTERKQTELALQKYIREVEDLYNNAPCGYHSLDAEGTMVRINDTELSWLGYTRDEILYKIKFLDLLSPDGKQVFYDNFPKLKQQGWVKNLEFQMFHKDGSNRWFNLNATAIKDAAGNFVMTRSTLFDISDRKQIEREREKAELALRESEEQRRLALDLTHIGFWDLDLLTGKLVWNDNHFTLLGLVPDRLEPSYEIWRERLHPEDRARVERQFADALQSRLDYESEYRVVHPDGSVHWLMGRGKTIYQKSGQPVRSLGVILDISDRKRAEETLRKYERIVSNTKDGIALVNRDYIYQIANQVYLSMCNKSESEVVGNSVINIQGDELFNNFCKPLLERCLSGETIQYEKWFDFPNLVRHFLSVTYSPFRDAGENISGYIISVRDLTQLKQAEQMLELQAVITRNMAEGICLVRADNAVIVYANPKFEQMFGYDFDELNGKDVSILNYPSESLNPEDVYQAIRSAVLQGGEFSYEVHNVKKDGTEFWCTATCSVFQHPEYGDVLVAVQQDITDRKLAQAALLQKSRQENLLWTITQAIRQSLDLNAILNTAVSEVKQTLQVDRAAIYRFTPDWSGDFVVESVDPQWVKLVGCNIHKFCEDVYLQETQGGRFRNHETFAIADIAAAGLHPCHIQLLQQFQAQAYMAVPIFSGEFLWGLLIVYQNTAPRDWQSWEIELLEQISSQLAIAIQQSQLYTQLHIELQERQQATAVIREAERRWRSLLENVQLIVVGLDASGTVNYINPFFVTITGYTNEEVLGNNWFENFLPSSSKQSTENDFLQILTHNAHPYYRNVILTKSGEERFIAWNNTTLQDADGTIIGNISIGEDITERNKIEQIKDEFIGIVSHELRTPLTAIQMSLGLLKTGIYDKKPEKSRRMIEIALLDTNRLVNLVNDILDLERLESGRAFLDKTLCNAADLMQQAVDGIQAIAAQHQISLIVTPSDAQVWAAADAILQTLTNLLSNAIKFSPADAAIYLSAKNQPDCVLFQVRDRGRGIPADKLELVFGRFQQVDASDSREKGGTGLGLPICRSIIERHGGKIWVESIFGEGSTFLFTLPLPAIE